MPLSCRYARRTLGTRDRRQRHPRSGGNNAERRDQDTSHMRHQASIAKTPPSLQVARPVHQEPLESGCQPSGPSVVVVVLPEVVVTCREVGESRVGHQAKYQPF